MMEVYQWWCHWAEQTWCSNLFSLVKALSWQEISSLSLFLLCSNQSLLNISSHSEAAAIKQNQSLKTKTWWKQPTQCTVFWDKAQCQHSLGLIFSCGWMFTKESFLDAVKHHLWRQNKHRERRWFEKGGGGTPVTETAGNRKWLGACVLIHSMFIYL